MFYISTILVSINMLFVNCAVACKLALLSSKVIHYSVCKSCLEKPQQLEITMSCETGLWWHKQTWMFLNQTRYERPTYPLWKLFPGRRVGLSRQVRMSTLLVFTQHTLTMLIVVPQHWLFCSGSLVTIDHAMTEHSPHQVDYIDP